MSKLLKVLAIILLAATLIPVLPLDMWFVRVFDFPRLQILILLLLAMLAFAVLLRRTRSGKVFIVLLLIAFCYQAVRIFPYTPLSLVRAKSAETDISGKADIKVLVANVFMKNHEYKQFIQLVEEEDPDLFLTLESDRSWEEALDRLSQEYPHVVKVPQDNTYGMHLYSRLPLHETQVKYWVDKEIPSINTLLLLPSGDTVQFYGVHPKPPVPTEDEDSKRRDAEIMIIGNRVADCEYPVIVAGDFNDVAWSSTTQLFLETSGLLDPRIGRGFYNTFNANNVLLRWPLDHFFYSTHFKLKEIRRYPDINSDHFPIGVHLTFEPLEKHSQKPRQPDEDTQEEETKTIREGLEDARTEED